MVNPSSDSTQELPLRAVLLGASNVARGFSTIVQTARWACGSPLEIHAAMGRGRSYGTQSSILGRKICGILECGLWQPLENQPNSKSVALVTDIGNDLLYGSSVSQLFEWVKRCLDRLEALGCRVVVTELPVENVRALLPWQFLLARSVLVPSCRLSLGTILERTEQLNDKLQVFAAERKIPLIPQKTAWFGFDPIHIQRRHWGSAWQEILSPWCLSEPSLHPTPGSLRQAFYLHTRVPKERSIWGMVQRREQPAGRLPDGTTISLY